MKQLTILLSVLCFTSFGQDSTSIQYKSEVEEQFKPVKLVDAFDKAFGYEGNTRLRFKLGLEDHGVALPSRFKKSFVSAEVRFIERFSAQIQFGFKPITNFDGSSYSFLKLGARRYFKKNAGKNLNGPYLEVSLAQKLNKNGSYGTVTSNFDFLNQFLLSNQFMETVLDVNKSGYITLGQQFGSIAEMGIRTGYRDVVYTKYNYADYGLPLRNEKLFFLSTFSNFSIGFDKPKQRKSASKCEFLSCQTSYSSLFKINLSNLLHIDKLNQNIIADISFEQKLGKLPLSISVGLNSNFNRFKYFQPTGEYDNIYINDTLTLKSRIYYSELSTTGMLGVDFETQLRYYLLSKSKIAKGQSSQNLSGMYLGLFYKNGSSKVLFKNTENLFSNSVSRGYGLLIGHQQRVLKNYFYDFALEMGSLSECRVRIARGFVFNPQFKFGYAF